MIDDEYHLNNIAVKNDNKKVILGINHLMLLDPRTRGIAHIIPIQPALDPVNIIKTKITLLLLILIVQ